MKFTDGYWLMRQGVAAHFARQVYEVQTDENSVKAVASTVFVRHRGDTLMGPALTVELSSPAFDVVRVRVTHFEGQIARGPHFEIADSAPKVQTAISCDSADLTTGALKARIALDGPWSLVFEADGNELTRSTEKSLGYMVTPEGRFLHEQLGLGVGELVYGLGERFTAFAKNGQEVEIWNRDGGTGSEQAYKNVPFYLTNRGYGVFVRHTGRVSFEVASEKVSRVQFSVPGEDLEYYVIYGPTPKEILAKYTALTGRPALPPAWSFGLWLTTSFTTNYDEATVTQFIQGMAERDIPLHVFHFDCFWMRGYHWCEFEWDPQVFPDPPAMLKRLHERGLRVCAWINPYVGQRSSMFEEGKRGGYLLKKPNGDVWQGDQWQPGLAIVDFTNPEACKWYAGKLRTLARMGVDCFKTDFGERIPTDVAYFDGSDPVDMHNYFTLLYNRTVFEVLEEERGKGEAVVFARSATAGGQRYPAHWGGDCYSDFPSMAESLRGGLSLGLCGFGFWSHDIGGFEGLPPASIYKRWVAFGLMSSHSRLHGSSSYRVPWNYDDEACEVVRRFANLKCSLAPYIYALAVEARDTGTPVMRAMLLEFPDDLVCHTLDRQYMLGPSLLVAPVFSESGEVDFYLPKGRWTHLLNGGVAEGGAWRRETHGFFSLPLYVRPNSIVVKGSDETRPDYDYSQKPVFEVYELEDGGVAMAAVPDLHGDVVATLRASRRGSSYEFALDGSASGAKILLINQRGVVACDACSSEAGPRGVWIAPLADGRRFSVRFE